MAIEHAMAALQEHWDDVTARLGPERSRQLRELIDDLGGTDHARVLSRIVGLLVAGLPSEHPVRRALTEGTLFLSATKDPTELRTSLRARGSIQLDAEPTPDGLLRSVAERLLRAPALTEDQVAGRGGDPADPGLIRLDRPDGPAQWPSFQFAPDGGPWPVVREINQILDAATYPLGAAEWWLSRNDWLDEVPSELIGVADDRLVRAARAIRSEV
ncbi:MAG: hypothetical protein ACRDPY_22815 [Streptosporangiaceae bacterium]